MLFRARTSAATIQTLDCTARHLLGRGASALAAVALAVVATSATSAPVSHPAFSRPALGAPLAPLAVPNAAHTRGVAGADVHVLVEFTQPSAVEAYVTAFQQKAAPATPEAQALGISVVKAQMANNAVQQNAFVGALRNAHVPFQEIYRVQRVKNAVAMIVPSSQVAALRQMPGVKSVRNIIPSKPSSLTSVPFTLAPEVWQGIPNAQADGTGIKIGIIDTGIDYTHANFGGTGALADYQDNDRVSLIGINSHATLFPTAKVAGGYDLAGDNYDANGVYGSTTPTPDPNPIDCGGHGSHVAGTAAGFGVTSAGATYASGYTAPIDPSGMKIFPGMAPNAKLYAFRVFGCGGSTDLVIQAIDMAMDPNNDGNFSDHMDVINMSLGSDGYGPSTLDAEAADAAAQVGVIVVAAAGNAGDTYLITGSPASSTRTISVAAAWDGGESALSVNVSASTAPTSASYFGVPAAFGPAFPTGTPLGGSLVYAIPNNGCAALTNAAAIAGNIAVIDRGACAFQNKVTAAQNAGAVGVVVVDNQVEVPITMAGTSATIPSAMISLANGQVVEGQLAAGTASATVAVVAGGDLIASFSSRGPTNNSPIGLKPDLTGPGVNVVSTQTGMTCVTGGGCITPTATGYDAGNGSLVLSGTSMATPHVAGMMALLKQLHPTLSVEELKALAMNGALHDLTTSPGGAGLRYGAGRVGAGRIDAQVSANLEVAAYNNDGSGAVSLTFPSEITGTTVVNKTLHVVNHGATSATFTLGIDTVVDNPGIAFSLPGGTSLTLAAGASTNIQVRMTGTANSVLNTFDPTILPLQSTTSFGAQPRFFMTEETSYLDFKVGGNTKLRVPLYVSPYPAGVMAGDASINTGGVASGTLVIHETGTPVCSGTLSPGNCTTPTAASEVSLVTPFELQASNPRNTSIAASGNIKNIGVQSGTTFADTQPDLTFGIATWGEGSVQGTPGHDVEVTLLQANPPGSPTLYSPLYTLYTMAGQTSGGNATNVYFTAYYDYSTSSSNAYFFSNIVPGGAGDTRLFQNDVFLLSAPLAELGLTPTSTIIYVVDSYDENGNLNEELGPYTYNIGAPGLDFAGDVLDYDVPGKQIPFTFNAVNFANNGSLGALLLHHHNKVGSTAQVIPLTNLAAFELTVTPAGAGTGTVTSSPAGIDCGATCAAAYAKNATVVLTAVPAAGSMFTGWSGACTGTATCSVTMTAAKSVTATFAVATYAVTVTKAGNGSGSVTSAPAGINCGTTCSATFLINTTVVLTATPGTGQNFTGWSGSGCTGTATCTIVVTAASPVTATFTDTIAPSTTILSGPSNPSSLLHPVFTFSSPDPTATFQCSLDGAAFVACTSPDTLTVNNGTHTFVVRAVDPGGNVDPEPPSYTWLAQDIVVPAAVAVPVTTLTPMLLAALMVLMLGAGVVLQRRG